MKKAKLLSSLVALTTLGGTVATIATSCNSKNGEKQVDKATIEKIYAGSNDIMFFEVKILVLQLLLSLLYQKLEKMLNLKYELIVQLMIVIVRQKLMVFQLLLHQTLKPVNTLVSVFLQELLEL